MAKISTEAKRRYSERITEYKTTVEKLLQEEKTILDSFNEEAGAIPYKKVELAEKMLARYDATR